MSTEEMVKYFDARTSRHILRVQKNLAYILNERDDFDYDEVFERISSHDKSKYSEKEREGYILLTWYYKCKSVGIEYKYDSTKSDGAWEHHQQNNPHHPEFHDNIEDMTNVDIAEMVSDWWAMSEENDNSLKDWADSVCKFKYKFTKEQTKLIYELVELFEG